MRRQPAKGIKSIRNATGALLWNIEDRDGLRPCVYSRDDAERASVLPGGQEAAWYIRNMMAILRIIRAEFNHPHTFTKPAEYDFESAFPDVGDRARVLYYVGLALGHVPDARRILMAQSAALGYTAAIIDGHRDDSGKARALGSIHGWQINEALLSDKIEKLALQGNWHNIRFLAECKGDPFWVLAGCANQRPGYMSKELMTALVHDGGPNGVYERGILYDDLLHAGFALPDAASDIFAPSAVFAQRVNAHVKQVVNTWLLIATRLRVVKDIRRVIGMMLWDERLQWAEPFAEQHGLAADPGGPVWRF